MAMADIRGWMSAADSPSPEALEAWNTLYLEVMGNDFNRFEKKSRK